MREGGGLLLVGEKIGKSGVFLRRLFLKVVMKVNFRSAVYS